MTDIEAAIARLARQEQFLDVVNRDEATARFHRHLACARSAARRCRCRRRSAAMLARAVVADVDVPGFDRSSVDGFAVRADDTAGASERQPKPLALNAEILTPGTVPATTGCCRAPRR